VTHEPPTGWDSSAHPDLERLAELEEGLLEPSDAARVEEHLAGCDRCHEDQAQLGRTRTLLRALPAVDMPGDVASRLQAALASADSSPTTSAQPTTVVPLGTARRRWRGHPTAAGLGAAAAVAALVAALVVGHNSGGGGSATPDQTTALAPAPTNTALADLPTSASGTDYTTHNLATTVPALIAGPAASMMTKAAPGAVQPKTGAGANSHAAGTAVAGVPAALLRLHNSPDALLKCVIGVEAGGDIVRPLAIDFAHYQGAPAALIVLPGLNSGFVDAWFVGPACSNADAHLLGYKALPSSSSASPGG
jgi:hypothetical protein